MMPKADKQKQKLQIELEKIEEIVSWRILSNFVQKSDQKLQFNQKFTIKNISKNNNLGLKNISFR